MPAASSLAYRPQNDKLRTRLRMREQIPTHSDTFKKSSTTSKGLIGRLTLSQVLSAHTGCVNALSWNQGGDLLISGSDDTHLSIWRYSPGPTATELVVRFATGHRANIFSAKFMPGTNDNVVACCAGDGDVRVFDISYVSSRQVLRTAYTCHRDRAKRIVTIPNDPSVFLSCGEDGTVRRFDLRMPHRCCSSNNTGFGSGERTGCPAAVVNLGCQAIELNGISLSHLNTNYIVLGGSDPHMLLYDIRSTKIPVNKFKPAEIRKNGNITSVKFSQHNGREVIGSWHNHHVHMFDISQSSEIGSGERPTNAFRNSAPNYRNITQPASSPISANSKNLSITTHQILEAFTSASTLLKKNRYHESLKALKQITTFFRKQAKQQTLSWNSKKIFSMALRNKAVCFIAWTAHDLHMNDMQSVSNENNSSSSKRKREPTTDNEIPDLMLAQSAPSSPPQPKPFTTMSEAQLSDSDEDPGSKDPKAILVQRLLNASYGAALEALNLLNLNDDLLNINRATLLRAVAGWGIGAVDPSKRNWEMDQVRSNLSAFEWPIEDEALEVAIEEAKKLSRMKEPTEWIRYCLEHMVSLEIPIFHESNFNDSPNAQAPVVEFDSVAACIDESSPWKIDEIDELIECNNDHHQTESWKDMTLDAGEVQWREDTDEEDEVDETVSRRAEAFSQVETIQKPIKSFKGHMNNQTVKDCNFLGYDSGFVVSGSDTDGLWLIWEKKTGKLINILRGDEQVVNVIEGHPFLPVVAVSGIDKTVKIFEPVYPKQAGESINVDEALSVAPDNTQQTGEIDNNGSNAIRRRRLRVMGLSGGLRDSSLPSLTRLFKSDATNFPKSTFESEVGLQMSSSILYRGGDVVRESEFRRKDRGDSMVMSRAMLRTLMAGRTGTDVGRVLSGFDTGAREDEEGGSADENCPLQ